MLSKCIRNLLKTAIIFNLIKCLHSMTFSMISFIKNRKYWFRFIMTEFSIIDAKLYISINWIERNWLRKIKCSSLTKNLNEKNFESTSIKSLMIILYKTIIFFSVVTFAEEFNFLCLKLKSIFELAWFKSDSLMMCTELKSLSSIELKLFI